jgi:hypothetical protein
MRTLFTTGIQGPRHNFWMGQQAAYVTTTPTQAATTPAGPWDVIAQSIKSGADIYGSYGDIQEAEAAAEAKRAEIEAKESAARTAAIMQQTSAIQQQTAVQRNQIAGVDKTAFFIGATILGLATVGGLFYLFSKGK